MVSTLEKIIEDFESSTNTNNITKIDNVVAIKTTGIIRNSHFLCNFELINHANNKHATERLTNEV